MGGFKRWRKFRTFFKKSSDPYVKVAVGGEILLKYAPGQLSVISLSMLITETNIDDCITMLVLTFLNMTVKLKRGG